MFEAILPGTRVRQKPARATLVAFLVHACVFVAAIGGTITGQNAVPVARRDTFLLQMSEVPTSPGRQQLPDDAPDLPAPPSIDHHPPELPHLGMSFTVGELPDPTGAARAAIGRALPVGLDTSGTTSKPAEVSGGVEAPELLGGLQPDYPEGLRRAGVRGMVRVEYVVGVDGRMDPRSLRVLYSTHPGFVLSAVQALRNARFRPAQREGRAVAARVQQIIRFTMQ
jgi:protein TonB